MISVESISRVLLTSSVLWTSVEDWTSVVVTVVVVPAHIETEPCRHNALARAALKIVNFLIYTTSYKVFFENFSKTFISGNALRISAFSFIRTTSYERKSLLNDPGLSKRAGNNLSKLST